MIWGPIMMLHLYKILWDQINLPVSTKKKKKINLPVDEMGH